MKDKRVLIALAMALGILLVAACSSSQTQSVGTPVPASTAVPTATAVKPAATPTQPAGAPIVKSAHQPIDQRSDCLACHKQGGFMPAPANHAGRTNETCKGCHQVAAAEKQPVLNLVAAKADKAPTLDGVAEDAWSKAKPLTIHVNGGINKSETDVTLKALYTQDTVYFLAQYKDPNQSSQRQPWQKQADGTWKKLPPNPYYEDKFAFIWNVGNSIKGFNEQGCAVACHATTPGRDRPLKYTNAAGEVGDTWHIKTVRTVPVGQIDDQYLDNDTQAAEAGRKSDAKTSGGYSDNVKEGQTTPPFALPNNKPAPPYYISDAEKVPFDDSTYKANDEVPGIIISPFVGDRGDLSAKGVWKDGAWTFEWSRKLQTGSKTDVQFDNLKGEYFFGVANFDNAQIGHAVQYGVTKFTFE
ncbi:MAG: ethylbenzene dehydrogenase-related protein [Dehalococcoidia bacterium]|nr:ethylbenzene dehydrogenase-related protein [Dehalococcoidia bacterium]